MTIRIQIHRESNHSDIKQWCRDNFGTDWWDDDAGVWSWAVIKDDMIEFEFFKEDDATLFQLRWL